MTHRAWLAALIAVAVVSLGRGCAAPTTEPLDPGAPRVPAGGLRVMTFNVNYALADHPDNIAAIEQGDADVVLLQETTADGELAVREALGDRYPHMRFRDCCNAGGLGILSKYPIADEQYLASPTRWFPAWRFVIDAPGGPVQLLDVHLRPPISDSGSWIVGSFTTDDIRLAEIEAFGAALDPALPTIVAGDFNESERGDAVAWLGERGFSSVLPQFDRLATTWRWALPLSSLQLRLDHIVAGPQWRAVDARVLDAGVSDHRPVLAVLVR